MNYINTKYYYQYLSLKNKISSLQDFIEFILLAKIKKKERTEEN